MIIPDEKPTASDTHLNMKQLTPPVYITSLLLVAQLFGATPINLFQLHPKSSCRTVWFRITNMLHICWSAAVFATIIAGMVEVYRLILFKWRTMELCLSLCEQASSLLNCAIAIVGGHLQRHKFALFWQQMQELDAKLCAAYQISDADQRAKDSRLSVFLRFQFALQVLLCANTIVVILVYADFDAAKCAAASVTFVLPNVILVLTMTQYNGLLYFVRERIDVIVADLVQARRQLRRASNRLMSSDAVSTYALLIASVHARIGLAQRMYRELCVFESATHRAFGVLMVSTMLSSFFVVTIELYQFYVLVSERFSIIALVHSIDWTLLHFGKLFLVLYLCTMVGNAVSSTAVGELSMILM